MPKPDWHEIEKVESEPIGLQIDQMICMADFSSFYCPSADLLAFGLYFDSFALAGRSYISMHFDLP